MNFRGTFWKNSKSLFAYGIMSVTRAMRADIVFKT